MLLLCRRIITRHPPCPRSSQRSAVSPLPIPSHGQGCFASARPGSLVVLPPLSLRVPLSFSLRVTLPTTTVLLGLIGRQNQQMIAGPSSRRDPLWAGQSTRPAYRSRSRPYASLRRQSEFRVRCSPWAACTPLAACARTALPHPTHSNWGTGWRRRLASSAEIVSAPPRTIDILGTVIVLPISAASSSCLRDAARSPSQGPQTKLGLSVHTAWGGWGATTPSCRRDGHWRGRVTTACNCTSRCSSDRAGTSLRSQRQVGTTRPALLLSTRRPRTLAAHR